MTVSTPQGKHKDPVLIVGAGITGLILGQALKQKNIPFTIYERDPSLTSRHQGWALTLHWALNYLPSLVPEQILKDIEAVQVDEQVAKNDTGNFLFLDLSTGGVKWKIPPNKRWRVNREKLRAVLVKGIEGDIIWGVKVEGVKFDRTEDEDEDDKPRLLLKQTTTTTSSSPSTDILKDRTSPPGKIIIGTEGARSSIRQFLCPTSFTNYRVPVRFTGASVSLTEKEIAPLRAIDPLLFQGCHPTTGVFFWFSMLDAPGETQTSELDPKAAKEDGHLYKVQLGMSWPVKGPADEVPSTNEGRLQNMKRRAEGFVGFLYEVTQEIPDGTEVVEVTLQDWMGPGSGEEADEGADEGSGSGSGWDNRDGKVTLAGEAAHAMTMYRGEAGNHGILDVHYLVAAIERIYAGGDAKDEIDRYEAEMSERGRRAVLLSRRACIEAHQWESLNEGSAILAKRKL
ncbi:hypothetical protein BDV18DRAFT_154218 [Aspergillus unguis]